MRPNLFSTFATLLVTYMQHIRFWLSIDSGAGAQFAAAVGRSAKEEEITRRLVGLDTPLERLRAATGDSQA